MFKVYINGVCTVVGSNAWIACCFKAVTGHHFQIDFGTTLRPEAQLSASVH